VKSEKKRLVAGPGCQIFDFWNRIINDSTNAKLINSFVLTKRTTITIHPHRLWITYIKNYFVDYLWHRHNYDCSTLRRSNKDIRKGSPSGFFFISVPFVSSACWNFFFVDETTIISLLCSGPSNSVVYA
jgi:hypothetical protein